MYAVSRKMFGGRWHQIYVKFDNPFEKRFITSRNMLTKHADLIYNFKTLKIIKNRDNIELTEELLQKINDVLLIEEL